MDGLVCDACGGTLLLDEDVRYVLQVSGHAAYDPIELSADDLARRDLDAEMRKLLSQLESLDAAEAQDSVHRAQRFDLCPACWRRYLQDPLRGARPPVTGEGSTTPEDDGPNGG